ncbi:AmmeMemoRadiSam system protein A [bacterium]|nr:AmmeMemoRadiSam system protein A [bacterium]MBU1958233.1 AmmeMemoRadiSam system protein A [bacterium]
MEETIIALAKAAILVALNQAEDFNLTQARNNFPLLNEQGAVFVTLRTLPNYELRGCIGSLTAYRPLYKDIIFNAQAAAMKDPRFLPLKKEELPNIKLEVALLSEPKDVNYSSVADLQTKIRPFHDGVVLQLGKHRATYLPSVWEELPKFDAFFSSLCLKAGLTENCLDQHPTLSTYQATKYKEK